MTLLDMQTLAPAMVELLINSLPTGLLIAFGAWLLLRVVGRQNSGTRFAIWFSSLLMIAGLPLFNLRSSVEAAAGSGGSSHSLMLPASIAAYVAGVWALISFVLLLRVGVGLWNLGAVRRSCLPIEMATLDVELQRILNEQNARKAVLCSSELARVPAAMGFLRPIVVLPEWALRDLSPAELNAVVLHEVAHLNRWDDWTNLAQKVLRAVLFFHPAMWWIDSRLSLEREMACDDVVLSKTDNPRQYAECLVSPAEKSVVRRSLAMAQAAIGRISDMAARLSQILDQRRTAGVCINRHAWAGLGTLALVTVALAPHSPQIVAFEKTAIAAPQVTASQISVPPQFVVPAMQHVATPAPVARRRQAVKPHSQASQFSALEARRAAAPPAMVQASMPAAAQPQTQTVYVTQTGFNRSGEGYWSIQIVRLTLTVPAQAAQGVPPAKIT